MSHLTKPSRKNFLPGNFSLLSEDALQGLPPEKPALTFKKTVWFGECKACWAVSTLEVIVKRKLGPTADYFELQVEIIHKMEQCSLIRFEEREFVVDTSDLVFAEIRAKCARQQAA
jgi:hypothetical protein